MSIERAAELLALRSTPDLTAEHDALLQAGLVDPDARVRTAALTVLCERPECDPELDAFTRGASDPSPAVRRRVGELAAAHPRAELAPMLLTLLSDADITVAEAAAAALGECPFTGPADAVVDALARAGTDHEDPLVRESAIAALGSIGDPRGLPAILHGCTDKPAIRRRAVLALAPFDGPDVNAAIDRGLTDRDAQTRAAAAVLRSED